MKMALARYVIGRSGDTAQGPESMPGFHRAPGEARRGDGLLSRSWTENANSGQACVEKCREFQQAFVKNIMYRDGLPNFIILSY
jgi:hypothetical protein